MRTYLRFIALAVRARLQFRAGVLVGLISVLVLNTVNLGLISLLLDRFGSLAGWSEWEVVFLYCLWLLGHGVCSVLFWHVDELEHYILQGSFDRFLLRPASPLVQYLGSEVSYVGITDLLVGAVGLLMAWSRLGLEWTVLSAGAVVVCVVTGAVIELSLTLGVASLSFWVGRSTVAVNTVVFNVSMLTQQYPLEMFGRWFRIFVTCVVPVAFMNYWPATVMLGRTDGAGVPAWIGYLGPLVALVLLRGALAIWRAGLRAYSSAGN